MGGFDFVGRAGAGEEIALADAAAGIGEEFALRAVLDALGDDLEVQAESSNARSSIPYIIGAIMRAFEIRIT
jgi:hypothetical protein